MAKITTVQTRKFSQKFDMPKDMLLRHKLPGNSEKPVDSYHSRNRRVVKKFAQMIKAYRQSVHGVNENSLAAPFRNMAHYFTLQLTRADSDNPRDRKGLDNNAPVETDVVTA